MSFKVYSKINELISTLIRRLYPTVSYRWGYQYSAPPVDQNNPLFYAYFNNIKITGITPDSKFHYSPDGSDITVSSSNFIEIQVNLNCAQPRGMEEYVVSEPEHHKEDPSYMLANLLSDLWGEENMYSYESSGIGMLNPGLIMNKSRYISGRYVRIFSMSLNFSTIFNKEYTVPTVQKVNMVLREKDTGVEETIIIE